jgi:hypothetical protein
MIISRERHLDDTSLHHVTLTLQTRTHEMHSLLSDAPDEVRQRVAEVLVEALNQLQSVLAPLLGPRRGGAGASEFGCGT